MFKKANKKGFTLIELIIVVAIMAVLVALLAPNVLKYLENSRINKDKSTLDTFRTAVEAELMDDDLVDYTTYVGTGDAAALKAKTLESIEDAADELAKHIFGEGNALKAGSADDPFGSKAAAGCEAFVIIDGKGGVAVVAATADGTVAKDKDGDYIYVATNFAESDIINASGKIEVASTPST